MHAQLMGEVMSVLLPSAHRNDFASIVKLYRAVGGTGGKFSIVCTSVGNQGATFYITDHPSEETMKQFNLAAPRSDGRIKITVKSRCGVPSDLEFPEWMRCDLVDASGKRCGGT